MLWNFLSEAVERKDYSERSEALRSSGSGGWTFEHIYIGYSGDDVSDQESVKFQLIFV